MRRDGSGPLCSRSQVRSDNCRLCAAETDDYGLYCLSQAQSALIQQSHIALIYESHAPRRHTPPLYHTVLCSCACFRSPPLHRRLFSAFYCRASTRFPRNIWPANAALQAACRCRLGLRGTLLTARWPLEIQFKLGRKWQRAAGCLAAKVTLDEVNRNKCSGQLHQHSRGRSVATSYKRVFLGQMFLFHPSFLANGRKKSRMF